MYQKVILVGNLGRDPEPRYSPNGQAVTNFSMATSEKWTDAQGQVQERTVWWRIAVWGKQAEACGQYLKKGSKVLVEGRMNPDSETGGPRVFARQDGTSGASYDVTAFTVKFLSSRGDGGGGFAGDGAEMEMAAPHDEGDIPF